MIIGTHNSATSGRLVWWLRPLSWLLHLTSRCQSKSIQEQLCDGVRLFNLQVCKYKGEWHISHGLCIYEAKLFDILDALKLYSDTFGEEIIFQLYLDKNFFAGQDEKKFLELVGEVKKKYCSPKFVMQMAWIEGTNKYPHKTGYQLSIEEHYWTKTWSLRQTSSWLNRLPLPRYHAKRYNKGYRISCKAEYLMLDYYEL